jgi:hypothetical protein
LALITLGSVVLVLLNRVSCNNQDYFFANSQN